MEAGSSARSLKWAHGLSPISGGLYYEGVVDDLSITLDIHKRDTVTTFGIRTSYRKKPPFAADKENVPKVINPNKIV